MYELFLQYLDYGKYNLYIYGSWLITFGILDIFCIYLYVKHKKITSKLVEYLNEKK